jgi:death-on-curing protein
MSWVWVREDVVFAAHDRQLAEHGGAEGVRDRGAVLSALARPVNLAGYGAPDAADLAAAYAFGLSRNHGFVDGNKRIGWVAARLLLRLNGVSFRAERGEAVRVMVAVAAGRMDEAGLAAWFRGGIEGRA